MRKSAVTRGLFKCISIFSINNVNISRLILAFDIMNGFIPSQTAVTHDFNCSKLYLNLGRSIKIQAMYELGNISINVRDFNYYKYKRVF